VISVRVAFQSTSTSIPHAMMSPARNTRLERARRSCARAANDAKREAFFVA
jgi:hypothetical protein